MDQRERDLMEEVKAIIAEGAEANQTAEQPVVEPKADTKEATPDTKADDNKTKENIENNETKGDKEVASLQEQLLNGKSIADLEETAAGGGSAAGGNNGDGVSLGAANFAQGGHYSNITDDFRGLDSLVAKGTEEVSSIAGGAADLDTLSVAIEKTYEAPVVVHETLRVSFDEVEDGRHDGNLDSNVSSHLDISNNILDNANSHKSGLQLTNDSTPTLAGKSTPGATISVFDGEGEHATFLGRTTVDANGDWEYTPTSALADGDWSVSAEKPNWSYTYKAEVTSVDEAGNTHDYAPTTFYIPMESISVAPTDHL